MLRAEKLLKKHAIKYTKYYCKIFCMSFCIKLEYNLPYSKDLLATVLYYIVRSNEHPCDCKTQRCSKEPPCDRKMQSFVPMALQLRNDFMTEADLRLVKFTQSYEDQSLVKNFPHSSMSSDHLLSQSPGYSQLKLNSNHITSPKAYSSYGRENNCTIDACKEWLKGDSEKLLSCICYFVQFI